MRSWIPLTPAGMVALVIGAVSYLAGWRLGWIELMVVAAGCGLALVVAVPWVVGRVHVEVRREIAPVRVTVGQPAESIVTVTNTGRVPAIGRILDEKINGRPWSIPIPALHGGQSTRHTVQLPTDRRAVVEVGPAVLAKADPIGLMRREVAHNVKDLLYVHPAFKPIRPLPVGFAKDLEGPTSDVSPAGDVAFHTLREYQLGDDYRHIHWPSTARTGWLINPQAGSLMVRHYVDNRRPHMTVILDPGDRSFGSDDEFEVAVSIAASLVVSALHVGQPIAVRSGRDVVIGQSRPGNRQDALDRLAAVQKRTKADLLDASLRGLENEIGTSALVVITGGVGAAELMPIATYAHRSAHCFFVRVWPEGGIEPGSVPRARVLDVDSLGAFQFAWDREVT